jgi:hypothetical protein
MNCSAKFPPMSAPIIHPIMPETNPMIMAIKTRNVVLSIGEVSCSKKSVQSICPYYTVFLLWRHVSNVTELFAEPKNWMPTPEGKPGGSAFPMDFIHADGMIKAFGGDLA